MKCPARSFLLDGDFLQAGLLLALGAATLNLEIARRRYGDPGGERGDGNDACTTVSTFDGDKKNAVTVTRFLARGRRFQNRYKHGQKTQKVLTVGRRVNCRLLKRNFSKKTPKITQTTPALPHSFGVAGKSPLLPPRRRGDRQFTPGFRGTRHGFRPAKIRFVTFPPFVGKKRSVTSFFSSKTAFLPVQLWWTEVPGSDGGVLDSSVTVVCLQLSWGNSESSSENRFKSLM
ncbi:hypothetical protein Zmor_005797 [Zophobas morio]|uniref:Uncharacterized protein n=1 Tax=Zophobas morio TaxID=2755281 RepID=A0AA38MMD8_9CUCU|nr:hypothetical protein Zmor_005797 [Zophobas morio]